MNLEKEHRCDAWEVTVEDHSFDIRNVDESYWEEYGYRG